MARDGSGTFALPAGSTANSGSEIESMPYNQVLADIEEALNEIYKANLRSADLTGSDAKLVTGTAGANGQIAGWNDDGDLIDSGYDVADEDNMASNSASKLASQQSIKAYVDSEIANLGDTITLEGSFSPSGGSFPGSGSAQTGQQWIADDAGTIDSVSFVAGDTITAITDNASTSTFSGNWVKTSTAAGVTSVAGESGVVTASELLAGIGYDTTDSPQLAGLNLGHASDTTLTRGAAGFLAVEGKRVPSPASQAAGDVLYRGSTEWSRLAKGTAAQVLQMNTGATAPEWATLSTGALEFIATADISADATVDFTGFAGGDYDGYVFMFQNVVPATDNVDLYAKTSTDGGSNYDEGTSDYTYSLGYVNASGSAAGAGSTTSKIVLITDIGSAAGEDGVSGMLFVAGPHLAKKTHLNWLMGGKTATNFYTAYGCGQRLSSADVDAMRFVFSSGNLESGTITMYGFKNA